MEGMASVYGFSYFLQKELIEHEKTIRHLQKKSMRQEQDKLEPNMSRTVYFRSYLYFINIPVCRMVNILELAAKYTKNIFSVM